MIELQANGEGNAVVSQKMAPHVNKWSPLDSAHE